jgi:hypothetical protein
MSMRYAAMASRCPFIRMPRIAILGGVKRMPGVIDSKHQRSLYTELTVGLGRSGCFAAGVLKFSCLCVGVL